MSQRSEALREFAALLREWYPEDVFRPLSDADHRSVDDAMSGRAERTHVTRDAVSADMMRRAAGLAERTAAEWDDEHDGHEFCDPRLGCIE